MTNAFSSRRNVSRLVIDRLRAEGLEVASVTEMLSGAPDKCVLETADVEGRILITEDRDFGELVVRQRLAVRGVILLELDRLSNFTEAERVSYIVITQTDKLLDNLIAIEPSRLRIRLLRG